MTEDEIKDMPRFQTKTQLFALKVHSIGERMYDYLAKPVLKFFYPTYDPFVEESRNNRFTVVK